MQSRDFLFGLIHVPMYDYWWGLTWQEVQLLSIDQPLVVYDHKTEKKKGFKKVNPLDVIRAKKEWEEKYKGREDEKIKIDFSQYMVTGKKNV